MFKKTETQGILTNSFVDDYLLTWVEAFLIDRKASGLAAGMCWLLALSDRWIV